MVSYFLSVYEDWILKDLKDPSFTNRTEQEYHCLTVHNRLLGRSKKD